MTKKINKQSQAVVMDRTEIAILEALMDANEYVSGNALAESIGIS